MKPVEYIEKHDVASFPMISIHASKAVKQKKIDFFNDFYRDSLAIIISRQSQCFNKKIDRQRVDDMSNRVKSKWDAIMVKAGLNGNELYREFQNYSSKLTEELVVRAGYI